MPFRVQRRRTKGWRMPAGARYVGRGTVFGNPWVARYEPVNGWVVLDPDWVRPICRRYYCSSDRVARRFARWKFRRWIQSTFGQSSRSLAREHLRGRDLACWCPLDQPCHADVLLEIANS